MPRRHWRGLDLSENQQEVTTWYQNIKTQPLSARLKSFKYIKPSHHSLSTSHSCQSIQRFEIHSQPKALHNWITSSGRYFRRLESKDATNDHNQKPWQDEYWPPKRPLVRELHNNNSSCSGSTQQLWRLSTLRFLNFHHCCKKAVPVQIRGMSWPFSLSPSLLPLLTIQLFL